jgi:hypothetical protein
LPSVLSSKQIITLALQAAKAGSFDLNGNATGFASQAGQLFNAILAGLSDDYDLDITKKTFNFTFVPATVAIGNTNVSLASGPFFLPPDYLRAKFGDVMWFNNNYPYQLVPVDLAEFDQFIQQAGFQNFPTTFATDMSQSQILTTTATANGTTTLTGLGSTAGIAVGQVAVSTGIPFNTVVTQVSPLVLSNAATTSGTITVTFQNPPLAYVWPPAGGAYPAMARYYSRMQPITTPESSDVIPWFPNTDFLLRELTGQLMFLTGDDRWQATLSDNADTNPGGSRVILTRYLKLQNDTDNRAKKVQLDARRFGYWRSQLPPSKILGY